MKRMIQPADFHRLVSYSLPGTRVGIYRLEKKKKKNSGGIMYRYEAWKISLIEKMDMVKARC